MAAILHYLSEMYLYFAVKIPLYAYESSHDIEKAKPYYRIRWDGIVAKVRRVTLDRP